MISHWYFACCLQLTKQQHTFLLWTMNILENPIEDIRLLHHSLDEMKKANLWMNAYTLSAVFAARRKIDKNDEINRLVREAFEGILENLPDNEASQFQKVISFLSYPNSSDERLYATIKSLLNKFLNKPESQKKKRSLSETPYLDIEVFLPEVILLSLLHDYSDITASLLEDNDSDVSFILAQSLENKFGRLALKLAIEISLQHPDKYPAKELFENIINNPRIEPTIEPDLAVLAAKSFLRMQSDPGNYVKQELINFNSFLHPNKEFSFLNTDIKECEKILRRLDLIVPRFKKGPRVNEYMNVSGWSMLCRQWALLSALSSIDPNALCRIIQVFWKERECTGGKFYSSGPVSYPFSFRGHSNIHGKNNSSIKDQIENCALLQGLNLKFDKGGDKSLSLQNLIFSPWYTGFQWVTGGNPVPVPKLAMLNVAVGLDLAINLLRNTSQKHDNKEEFLIDFIMHGGTILGRSNILTQVRDDTNVPAGWSQQLPAVLRYAHDYVNKVGSGFYESISPETFLKATDENTLRGCLRYIEESILSTREIQGPSRWLRHIPQVLEKCTHIEALITDDKKHSEAMEKLLAALIWRFTLPTEQRVLIKQKFISKVYLKRQLERFQKDQGPTRWVFLIDLIDDNSSIRKILLHFDDKKLEESKKLAFYAVRLLLVDKINPDPAQVKEYRNKFLERLLRISESIQADRFLQFLLLELLNHTDFAEDEQLQLTIVMTLIEWGSASHLDLLVSALFSPDDDKRRREANGTRVSVRKETIVFLYRYIADYSPDTSIDFELKLPWDQLLDIQKIDVVKMNYVSILSGIIKDRIELKEDDQSRQLFDALSNYQDRRNKIRAENLQWKKPCDLSKLSSIDLSTSEGAVLDHNNNKVSVLISSLKNSVCSISTNSGVNNFFTMTYEGITSVLKKAKNNIDVIAVVAEKEDIANNDSSKVFFNVNWEKSVEGNIPCKTAEEMCPGDIGKISIKYRAKYESPHYIDYTWEKINPGLTTGGVGELTISFPELGGFIIEHQQEDVTKRIDPEIWMPNISELIANRGKICENVYGVVNNKNQWEPLDRHLRSFLLKEFCDSDSNLCTLTFISDCQDNSKTAWRVSTRNGKSYILEQSNFQSEDAEEITERLDSCDNPTGLLVTVWWDYNAEKLCLFHPHKTAEKNSPDLQFPFDQRNIDWRDFFPINSVITVNKTSQGGWVYQIDGNDSAFQNLIPIGGLDEERYWYLKDINQTDVMINDWTPHCPELNCTPVDSKSINIPKEKEDRDPLLDNWISVINGKEKHIILERFINQRVGQKVPAGTNNVLCVTKLGTTVWLRTESITMRAICGNIDNALVKNRPATVNVTPPKKYQLKIDSESLSAVFDERDSSLNDYNIVEGIFERIPAPGSQDATTCHAFLKFISDDDNPFYTEEAISIKIANWDNLNVKYAGCVLHGEKKILENGNISWKWMLLDSTVSATALWQPASPSSLSNKCVYLGRGFYNGKSSVLAESEAGKFIVLRDNDQIQDIKEFGNQLSHDEYLRVDSTYQLGTNFFKVKLARGKDIFYGFIERDVPKDSRQVRVSRLSIKVKKSPINSNGKEYFILKRDLELSELIKPDKPSVTSQVTNKDIEKQHIEKLKKIIADEEAIFFEFDKNRSNAKIKEWLPKSFSLKEYKNKNWTYSIPVDLDQKAFVSFAKYPSTGELILFEQDSKILASCKKVPPKPIDGLLNYTKSLRYAGPVDMLIPGTERPDNNDDRLHIFEWGYGRYVQIPEAQIKYEGFSFSQMELIILHGDKIRFDLEKNHDNSGEENEHETTTLRITKVDYNDFTHELYEQSKQNILFQLEISRQDDKLTINSVNVLNRKGLKTHSLRHEGKKQKISMSVDSEEHIIQLAKKKKKSRFTVFGKLDTDKIKGHSYGTELSFDYIYPGFSSAKNLKYLDSGKSIIFLEAISIRPTQNDLLLELSHISHNHDRGFPILEPGSLKKVVVLRRDFSIREDTLQQKGNRIVNDRLLLPVMVKQTNNGLRGYISNHIPPRNPEILRFLLLTKNTVHALIALVEKDSNDKIETITLELRPAVFVKLKVGFEKYGFQSNSKNLAEKDRVVVNIASYSDNNFKIERASSGQSLFIPDDNFGRPAIVFPMNSTMFPKVGRQQKRRLKNEPELLEKHHWFPQKKSCQTPPLISIGGLPDVIAIPGGIKNSPADLVNWMHQRTKVVDVWKTKVKKAHRGNSKRKNSKAIICKFSASLNYKGHDWIAGKLLIPKTNDECKYALWNKLNTERSIPWAKITYANRSVQSLIDRWHNISWTYHDTMVGQWKFVKEKLKVQKYKIEKNSYENSPVFFYCHNQGTDFDSVTLCYPEESIKNKRFALPVDELLQILTPKPQQFTVAGTTNEGLFIELSPGRIIELLGQMCVWKDSSEASLAELDWENFSTSDEITLTLAHNESDLDLESVALVNWTPSCSNALRSQSGGNKCLLPMKALNTDQGRITLGEGLFSFDLPYSGEIESQTVYFYPGTREIIDASDDSISENDVILVGLTDDNTFAIQGDPNITPDLQQFDYNDTSVSDFHSIFSNEDKLKDFIKAVGGSVPVSVKKVTEYKLDFVIPEIDQYLHKRLKRKRINIAYTVGWLASEKKIILRIGSWFYLIAPGILLKGIPDLAVPEAVEVLKKQNTPIFLSNVRGGIVCNSNFSELKDAEQEVAVISPPICTGNGEKEYSGVICQSTQSHQLAWLPKEETCLIHNLSDKEWKKIIGFVKDRRGLTASLSNKGVSLIDKHSIKKRLRSLKPGDQFSAELIAFSQRLAFAWSDYIGGIFKIKDLQAGSNKQIKDLVVEIVSVGSTDAPDIVTVQSGKRTWHLLLPQWFKKETELADTPIFQKGEQPFENSPDSVQLNTILDEILTIKRSQELTNLLRKTGKEALWSTHSDILINKWLFGQTDIAEERHQWIRVNDLIKVVRDSLDKGLDSDSFKKINMLFRKADLMPENTIAHGVIIALGVAAGLKPEPDLFRRMMEGSEDLQKIISMCRCFPQCKTFPTHTGILKQDKEKLESLKTSIEHNNLNVSLFTVPKT